jgi:hypothetical protein
MRFPKIFFFYIFFLITSFSFASNYFQQEVNYTIHVILNDRKHTLDADETIIYKNNSPVILKELYFHLWPSAYKDKNTILAKEIFRSGDDRMLSAEETDFGYIDSLDFSVNGEKVKWSLLPDTIDVCKIVLNKPLSPNDSIIISTPFHVKIPSASLSRLGHDGQAYYITQWYPKPAVFDNNGWNYFPYLDQGEFYSEFGMFDVDITLPENYLLAATGILQSANEKAWLNMQDSIARSIKSFPVKDSIPASSKKLKTVSFHQSNIHDFAWFADKSWHVLKEEIELPPTNRKINSWTFFNNNEAELWLKVPQYIYEAVNFYSGLVGEYPFESITMVDVKNAMGNGMEYPMIAAIGEYGDSFQLELTILHEAGHNWFYGILGSNERCHPWMDEGINNFYETRYVYTKYKGDPLHQNDNMNFNAGYYIRLQTLVNHRKKQYLRYLANARINNDQVPDQCAEKFSVYNYHGSVYYKTSISIDYLKTYLGDSLFDGCMKHYYEEWKFRHPEPVDMQIAFERYSNKKLDWLFNGLLETNKKLDYKIIHAGLKAGDLAEAEIKNNKEIHSPVSISTLKDNKIIETQWIEGFIGNTKIEMSCKSCDAIKIDAENKSPELYQENNHSRVKGIFRKTEKLKLSFGLNKYDPEHTIINYFPVIGWNNYNKLMAGAVIHNISPYEQKFEYTLMPLYAFGTNNIAGGGNLSYHIYPVNSVIQRIEIRSGISHYALGNDFYESLNNDFTYSNKLYFTKIDSRISFSFLQKNPQEHYKSQIMIRNIFINRDIPYQFNYAPDNINLNYWQVEFKRENTNPLNASLQRINVTVNEDFINLSGEAKKFITYGKRNKGFGIRFFGGIVDISNTSSGIDYKMSLSGRSGPSYDLTGMGSGDYLYDEVFLGRSESSGLLAHQYVNDYAGFRTPTMFYRESEKWMFGLNTSTTLPGFIPFRLFADLGTFYNSDQDGAYSHVSWELGVDLPVIKDIFIISLPFAYSKDIKYVIDRENLKTSDLVRFELHLNLLNPLTFVKNVYTD